MTGAELVALLAVVLAAAFLGWRLVRWLRGRGGCGCVEGRLRGADGCLHREDAEDEGEDPGGGPCGSCPARSCPAHGEGGTATRETHRS